MGKFLNNLIHFVFGRIFIIGLMLIIQLLILVFTIWKLGEHYVYIDVLFSILSLIVIVSILNKEDNPSYKLAWVIPIILFPVLGALMYIWFGTGKPAKLFETRLKSIPLTKQDDNVFSELESINKSVSTQSKYISDIAKFPIYKNTQTEYLSPGEKKFERLKQELELATHFIFMEYFIIQEGIMWDSILEILKRKVKQGVEVRIIYDDVGCLFTLPYKYDKKLESMGIKCIVFNKFRPALSSSQNNRDHRKITVIDGYVGFTGGINLADEYINAYEKHGHWKDCAVMIKGEAVWSLTIMFLQTWNFLRQTDDDFKKYMPSLYCNKKLESDGFVQPYCDSPLDKETVGENVYLNMITKAKDYIYINTPYLIIDNEMITALSIAAKSGIDIKIVTPHIADKWYVHMLTRSYYSQLINAGIKIYEYTPGFIHSKTFVCDDELATIGTINLDFRSLYLHFECGSLFYKSKAVKQLKDDYLETLKICTPITSEYCKGFKWYIKLTQSILRLLAPLM